MSKEKMSAALDFGRAAICRTLIMGLSYKIQK